MKLIIDIPDEQYEYIKLSDKNTFADVSSKECMLYAIKNGTPVSTDGDLISRSELKKAIENYLSKRQDVIIWETDMFNMLDNAPTVELFCAYLSDGEVRQPCVEAPCKHERPQGEWEKCQNDMFRCSNCRQADEVPTAMGTPIYNFCPNCGAKMQKGGTE